jgi:hypothetical protein
MKISPIAMLLAQLYGTFVGSICTTSIGWAMITTEPWISRLGVDPQWMSIGYLTFFNAGAIWGASKLLFCLMNSRTRALLCQPGIELCKLVYRGMGTWIYSPSCSMGIVQDLPFKVLEVYFYSSNRLLWISRVSTYSLNHLALSKTS